MQILFSNIKSVIVSQLQSASSEILVAVSWLTDRELFELLLDQLKNGVKVSIITRNDYLNNHSGALPWKQFIDSGGELRFCKPGKMLHYKFAVVDGVTAMATSYNWTCFAGRNNRENIMVIKEEGSVRSFQNEFEFLCSQFPLQKNPERIDKESVNEKLWGFYELTLAEDEKNQQDLKLE